MSDVFYTQASPNWEIAQADVTTDVHNIHDRNFDSQYELTGADSNNKGLWIDRLSVPISGSYKDIDTVAITMYSGSYVNWNSAQIHIYQNSAAQEGGKLGLNVGNLTSNLDANAGLFMLDLDTDYKLRFVNLRFVNMPADPIFTQVMLCRKHTTARNHSIKESHTWDRFYTKTQQFEGFRSISHSNYQHKIKAFRRHYPLYGTADYVQSQNIVSDSQGMLYPFIYTDGLLSNTFVCQFTKNTFEPKDIEHDHYEIIYEFEEIYRIKPGYTI